MCVYVCECMCICALCIWVYSREYYGQIVQIKQLKIIPNYLAKINFKFKRGKYPGIWNTPTFISASLQNRITSFCIKEMTGLTTTIFHLSAIYFWKVFRLWIHDSPPISPLLPLCFFTLSDSQRMGSWLSADVFSYLYSINSICFQVYCITLHLAISPKT